MNSVALLLLLLLSILACALCVENSGTKRWGTLFTKPDPHIAIKQAIARAEAAKRQSKRVNSTAIATNTADSLLCSGNTVDVSASGAPSYGQALIGTSGTTSVFAALPSYYYGNLEAATTSVTSTSYAVLSSFDITNPFAGTWEITFKGSVSHSTSSGHLAIAIYVGGTIVSCSDSFSDAKGSSGTKSVISTSSIVITNGSQHVSIYAYTNTGNTATITSGVMNTLLLEY